MAVQIEVLRTPDELAADLAELSTVDWNVVWRGYAEADPRQWSAQFGWRLDRVGRVEDLLVRLASGGSLDVVQDRTQPYPEPVDRVGQTCWTAAAPAAQDNDALFAAADEVWPGYLAAARRAVGDPTVTTAWDDPAFPESPPWLRREERLRQRRPYRLALWSRPGAVIELSLNPTNGAANRELPGEISLLLRLRSDRVAAPTGAS